jgi:hypothetical protein
VAIFGIFAVVAIVLVAVALGGSTDGPPVVFTAFWLGALIWNGYWWLFRLAIELSIDGTVLTWATPLRRGRIDLQDVTELRPMRLMSSVEVIGLRDRRPLLTPATKGIRMFTDELTRLRPDLSVRLGWQSRLAERLPGSSRTR